MKRMILASMLLVMSALVFIPSTQAAVVSCTPSGGPAPAAFTLTCDSSAANEHCAIHADDGYLRGAYGCTGTLWVMGQW